MTIKALLFNVHGTLIDTRVDDEDPELWGILARYLTYKGIYLPPAKLKEIYWHTYESFLQGAPSQHPEVDVLSVWADILQEHHNPEVYNLQVVTSEGIEFVKSLAQLYRSLSVKHQELFPGARELLERLSGSYRLGMVANGQHGWTSPEMKCLGIRGYFSAAVHSSDLGRCKPDPYLFKVALEKLGVKPSEALFTGNDMATDIAGAAAAGLETVLVEAGPGQKTGTATLSHRIKTLTDLDDLLKKLSAVTSQ